MPREALCVVAGAFRMLGLAWLLRGRPRHEQIIGWTMFGVVSFGFLFAYIVLMLSQTAPTG